ncbi:MAG: 50S ribosomal protein L9 [Desulfobulbaceae bacterium]|jgi:large subunit ribosomal protein L9|nr:50S ribosomal protein L9 [Desulfobulbaceae bacterium]
MKLILTETISTLGREGDVVAVKAGYGRNYLLPKKKGVLANEKNLAELEQNRAAIAARLAKEKEIADQLAARLAGVTVTASRAAGEDGRLFGSVTNSEIAALLAEQGVAIDRKQIVLAEPIKAIGEYTVQVKVGLQTTADLLVSVVAATEN